MNFAVSNAVVKIAHFEKFIGEDERIGRRSLPVQFKCWLFVPFVTGSVTA
jgi:hypothetical protein